LRNTSDIITHNGHLILWPDHRFSRKQSSNGLWIVVRPAMSNAGCSRRTSGASEGDNANRKRTQSNREWHQWDGDSGLSCHRNCSVRRAAGQGDPGIGQGKVLQELPRKREAKQI
jgi:hypothetical protein